MHKRCVLIEITLNENSLQILHLLNLCEVNNSSALHLLTLPYLNSNAGCSTCIFFIFNVQFPIPRFDSFVPNCLNEPVPV